MSEPKALDPELAGLLVCPNCRGPVEYLADQDVIACLGECRYRYPVVNGIPHMLVDEAARN